MRALEPDYKIQLKLLSVIAFATLLLSAYCCNLLRSSSTLKLVRRPRLINLKMSNLIDGIGTKWNVSSSI